MLFVHRTFIIVISIKCGSSILRVLTRRKFADKQTPLMSTVSLLNVTVLNNPARFTEPYQFEITFECLEPLQEDLEWKLVYVGSSHSSEHDQELDSLLVGPVPLGVSKFLFEAAPPNPDLIPKDNLVSITVMILSCSYREREFVQVGYYVNNDYDTPELRENPPTRVDTNHIVRNILAEKPRVTRYDIPWDTENTDEFPPEQPEADFEDIGEYGDEEEDNNDDIVDEEEASEVEVEGEENDEDEDDEEDEEDNGDTVANDGEDKNEEAPEAEASSNAKRLKVDHEQEEGALSNQSQD